MGCKYVKEFEFGGSVTGDKNYVKGYYRGGKVSDAAQDKAVVKAAVHKHEKAMHPGKPLTKLAKGGAVPGQKQLTRAMEVSYPKGATITPAKQPAMPKVAPARARKSVPVAPESPLVAMKYGGAAKMRKC